MTIKDPFFHREKEKYEKPIPSREYIVEHMTQLGVPQTFKQLLAGLKIHDEDMAIGLKRRLRAMEREGQIIYTKFRSYTLPDKVEIVTGTVIGHRDGYGFLDLDDAQGDWFIPAHDMKRLIHGDRVKARTQKNSFKNKPEAIIMNVIETRSEPIIGRYYIDGGMGLVVPEDARISQDIMIHPGQESGARVNQIVAVELTQRPSHRMNALGKIVEVMGDHMAPGMEIEIALRNHDIPFVWPEEVKQQVSHFGEEVPAKAKKGRVDLTQMPLVTIDGEDARDFDDAVYCETKKSGGWRLWVAIADVSSYVPKGSALDKEALNRGNSVYFPEQVIPMLPKVLSNGLCSLNPDVDRLCMVCEMTISARGNLSGFKFYEAVMRSAQRFTYTDVAAILEGDKALRAQHQHLLTPLENLHQLYQALITSRRGRGAIEFETVETRFVFNEQRKIDFIEPVHRNDAHKLIEECMILANVSAAKFIAKHEANGLYRVHDNPDQSKLTNFRSFLGQLGIETTLPLDPEPKELTAELERLADRDDIELIQIMLLRSMKQAAYQVENQGHFGLALNQYAHFTSPIRRYPDLVVHRTIKAILNKQGEQTTGSCWYEHDEAEAVGIQCSMTERRADDATREVSDWLKCEYMQDHIGCDYPGIIASVTNFGLFVRIESLYVDGLVHISSLANDYYHFDTTRHVLVGEASRKVYRMGDPIHVQVASVKLEQRKIDFVIYDPNRKDKRSFRVVRKGSETARDDTPAMSVREQLAKGLLDDNKPKDKSNSVRRTDRYESKPKQTGGKKAIGGKKGSASNKSTGKKKQRPGKNARRRAKLSK